MKLRKNIKATIVVLLDHVLDGQTGLDVLQDVIKHQKRFQLDIF